MARVEFEHVDKIYPGGTRAVGDCSLAVDDGELMVLVGPSGCGKSTLLRLLAGLEEVTAGVIRIGERVVNDLTPQERNVAMVFQDYALYPFLSVRRNLEFPLKMRKMPRAEMRRRVEWAAGLLDIAHLLDRLPRQLSGGQRQRVAMGRALVRQPAVFLLDEPLSNLDAKLRVQVRAEIGELQRRTGTTMIYVTHDQVEAMTLGDRVAVLDRGQLQQVAPPRELYDHPANVFVAGFIGSPPMNLFPAHLSGDGTALDVAGQTLMLAARRIGMADGRTITAGVRPEEFRLATTETSGNCLQTVVEHAEYLGHETLAHVRLASAAAAEEIRLVVRLAGMQPLSPGDGLRLEVAPASVHLFGEAGEALAG